MEWRWRFSLLLLVAVPLVVAVSCQHQHRPNAAKEKEVIPIMKTPLAPDREPFLLMADLSLVEVREVVNIDASSSSTFGLGITS